MGVLRTERLADVVGDLDAAVERSWQPHEATVRRLGLVPVATPSSHLVYRVEVDGEPACLKVFRSWARNEPAREWLVLAALDGTGLAPLPLWRSSDGRPAVLTSWLDGSDLGGRSELTSNEVHQIAAAHATLHKVPIPASAERAINAGQAVIQRVLDWWTDLGAMSAELKLSDEVQAYVASPPLASEPVAQAAAVSGAPCVVRGDTNLANYLCDQGTVRMIDFEDSGVGTRCFEVADMVEHFANRAVVPGVWDELWAVAEVDAEDLRVARAVVAEFWLALTIRRTHGGATRRPDVTPSEQLARTKALRT